MELDGLLNGNTTLIYFVGILYILINGEFDKNQKIIMIYVFTYMLKIFNIMDIKVMLIASTIVSFMYLEFLSKDTLKNMIFPSMLDKIKDYIYKCIFEYSSIYFLMSVFITTNLLQRQITILENVNIPIYLVGIKINIISIILFIITINNITSQKYETNYLTEIKRMMNKYALWNEITLNELEREKLNMLIDIEDKSYFIRDKSYNFLSLQFLLYKIRKNNKNNVKIIIKKISKKRIKEIILKKVYLKDIKKFIRGYSTIEMQIIRTLGVKYGYSQHVFCRKIYELMYSKMFFKNLRKYMNKLYLDTEGCCTFKEYLLIIYIKIAPIKLNKKRYKNMLAVWNKELKDVTKEEFFISILGLSNRKISNVIIYNYSNIVEKYSLNKKSLKRLIKDINEE